MKNNTIRQKIFFPEFYLSLLDDVENTEVEWKYAIKSIMTEATTETQGHGVTQNSLNYNKPLRTLRLHCESCV